MTCVAKHRTCKGLRRSGRRGSMRPCAMARDSIEAMRRVLLSEHPERMSGGAFSQCSDLVVHAMRRGRMGRR